MRDSCGEFSEENSAQSARVKSSLILIANRKLTTRFTNVWVVKKLIKQIFELWTSAAGTATATIPSEEFAYANSSGTSHSWSWRTHHGEYYIHNLNTFKSWQFYLNQKSENWTLLTHSAQWYLEDSRKSNPDKVYCNHFQCTQVSTFFLKQDLHVEKILYGIFVLTIIFKLSSCVFSDEIINICFRQSVLSR